MRRTALAAALALTLAAVPGLAANDELRALVESGRHPGLNRPDFGGHRADLQAAYQGNGFAPLWLDAGGLPTPQADAVIDALAGAGATGLLPADYDVRWLDSERARLRSAPALSASFDLGLTLSLMRFVSDSYRGRVDPRQVGFQFDLPAKHLDLPRIVAEIARSHAPAERLREFEPPFPVYQRLKAALEPLRRQAADLNLPEIPELPTLRPGDRDPGVPALRRTLALLGYLHDGDADTGRDHQATARGDGTAVVDADLYDPALAEAVARFQRRHGLESDGILGRQTARQLRVPLAHRVQQIELAMERLRWLPYQFAERFLVVNIPEFRLRGYVAVDGEPPLSMAVVVGSAAQKHETPVLFADMTYVVFRPYWYVPRSITRKELEPKIRNDARYAGRNHYQIVDGFGASAISYSPEPGALDALAGGDLRLRQTPGPHNALGLVKFIFPNPSHVYLHDTPSKTLFQRSRRDFSHGCIRVEDPVALAHFVLGEAWSPDRIRAAMQRDRDNQRVNLKTPIPVLLYYTTAVVEEDGELYFFDDIYGHDERLAKLLAKGYRVDP